MATCSPCGRTKSKFVKSTGGNLDIHKAMLPLLPKKCLTLPGYNDCGRPGNPLMNWTQYARPMIFAAIKTKLGLGKK